MKCLIDKLVTVGTSPGLTFPVISLDFSRHFVWHAYVYDYTPEIERLEEALRRAMADVPTFAGRIIKDQSGKMYLHCNDAGASLKVFEVDAEMPVYGPNHRLQKDFESYVDPSPQPNFDTGPQQPLFHLRLTKFRCGGCVIAYLWTHRLVDGTAYIQFLTRMAAYYNGAAKLPPPYMDRAQVALMLKSDGADVSTDYRSNATTVDANAAEEFQRQIVRNQSGAIEERTIVVTPEMLAKLKSYGERMNVMSGADDWVSMNDLLSAALIKKVAKVRKGEGANFGDDMHVSLAYNIRNVRELNLPSDYSGNAVIGGTLSYATSTLINGDLCDIARSIRVFFRGINLEMVKKEYAALIRIQNSGQFLVLRGNYASVMGKGIYVNNLSKFPLHELSLGGKPPIWLESFSRTLFQRGISIYPTGIDENLYVHIILPKAEMEDFQAEYSMSDDYLV